MILIKGRIKEIRCFEYTIICICSGPGDKDLDRNRPACFWTGSLLKNFLFGQAKISMMIFHF